jgi:branched-chain amino acid transport system substrate-binding protein
MAVAAATLGVTACGGGSTVNTSSGSGGSASTNAAATGSATSAAASSKGGWVVGSLIDETGTDANGGAAQKAGIDWYVKQINAAGGIKGHQVSVNFCDTQSTPTAAAQCAQQLAGVNTHVVLAQSIDPPTRGALPYLTHDLVVAVDPILLPKAGTNVFQATGASKGLLLVFAKAAKAAGVHTIGVLYTTDTSGTHQLLATRQAAAAAGLKVVAQPQDPGSTDVSPQLIKLRSAGADVIYLASVGTNTAAAVNSYRTLSMSQPIVAGAAAVTNGFLHSLSSIPQHLYGNSQLLVTDTGLPTATLTAFQAYLKEFKAQEGEPADTQTTSAVYDGCVALDALKGAGPSVPAMEHYLKTGSIDCLGSSMRYDLPGLNVINHQPASMAEARTNASQGWGPMQGNL